MKRSDKEAFVADFRERASGALVLYLTDFTGLDVKSMTVLREKLRDRRESEPNRRDLIVAPEDGVLYEDVVAAMDLVVGSGYEDMSLSDGAHL